MWGTYTPSLSLCRSAGGVGIFLEPAARLWQKFKRFKGGRESERKGKRKTVEGVLSGVAASDVVCFGADVESPGCVFFSMRHTVALWRGEARLGVAWLVALADCGCREVGSLGVGLASYMTSRGIGFLFFFPSVPPPRRAKYWPSPSIAGFSPSVPSPCIC